MKILPCSGEIQIKLEEASAGILDTSSRESAIEYGEVLSVGADVKEIKKGDTILVKSWAIDTINYKGKKYCFVNTKTNGVKAVIK